MENHHPTHPPCERHPNGRPVSTCPGCGKTVCSECIKIYGYFCSEACRDAARTAEPESESSEDHVDYEEAQQRYDTIARILFRRIPLALAALITLVVLIRWIDPTGDEQWRITLPGSAGIEQMTEIDTTLFVLDANGQVTALDTKTGEQQWTRPPGEQVSSIMHMDGALHLGWLCLDATDGSTRWELEQEEGVHHLKWQAAPAGLVAGSSTYSASSEGEDATWTVSSDVLLADPATGDVRWRRTLAGRTTHQVGFFAGKPWCLTSQPHEEESTIFQLEALNPEDGRRDWGIRTTGDQPPRILVSDERMLVVTPQEALGIEKDGTKGWAEPLDRMPALVTQGMDQVVLCLDRTELRSLDMKSGKTRWSTTVPGWVEGVSMSDHVLYATVAGWEKDGEAMQSPLESMPDGPEKQLLEELFFDEEETEDEEDGLMYAEVDRLAVYDLRTGRLKWDDRMDNGSVTSGPGCCYLQQTVSGMGSLMGGDVSGRLVARAASNGDVLWRFKSDAELTSLAEGERLLYLESTRILPEMLTKYGGGSPPEISLAAIRKHGILHRLTHW